MNTTIRKRASRAPQWHSHLGRESLLQQFSGAIRRVLSAGNMVPPIRRSRCGSHDGTGQPLTPYHPDVAVARGLFTVVQNLHHRTLGAIAEVIAATVCGGADSAPPQFPRKPAHEARQMSRW